MEKEINHKPFPDYSFYILSALVIILPLIFSTAFESVFTIVKNTAFRILSSAFFISIIIYLYSSAKQKKFELITHRALDYAILFVFFSALISTIFSINSYVSIFGQYARQIGLITYAIITLLYFTSSVILSSQEKRDKLLFAMTITAAMVGIYSVLQYYGFDPFKIQADAYTRPISSMGSSVFAAGLMVMVLPFAVIRAVQNKFSFIYVLIPVIILLGIVVSQTRTVYAAALVELVLFCLLYPYLLKSDIKKFIKAKRTGFIILGSIAVLLVIFIFIFPDSVFIKRFKGIINIRKTERWELWKTTFNMYWHYPVTGTGLSTFSRGLEDFLTLSLKNKTASLFYDHAHSNYFHTLATMGFVGLAAYIFLLLTITRNSITSAFFNNEKYSRNGIFLAFLCMICGYMVYGLADFDELTHVTYLFILMGLFKAELFDAGKGRLVKFKFADKFKPAGVFAIGSVIIIILSIYNMYDAYTEIIADKIYTEGIENYKYSNKNINDLNAKLNSAIELNPRAEYRYMYANYNFFYNLNSPGLNHDASLSLLRAAENHLKIAVENHPVKLLCLGLLSLINYYEGDTAEGEKIKNEVLAKDSLQSKFRIELARYYFIYNKEDLAVEQLNIVHRLDPRNIESHFIMLNYLLQKRDLDNAEDCCNKILKLEPGNKKAALYLNEIRNLKDILK